MYQSNISRIVRIKVSQLEQLQNPDQMLRTVAVAVLPELKKRVHVEGKASDGSQIGTYSPAYMKVRTGSYANASTYKKGKNKGKNKDAGTFTRGGGEGKARPKYNRTSDPKVIGSLTRQMENDLVTAPAGSGYGIGYTSPFNYQKSQWLVETYKKDIWKLTVEENELANRVAADFITQVLNNDQ